MAQRLTQGRPHCAPLCPHCHHPYPGCHHHSLGTMAAPSMVCLYRKDPHPFLSPSTILPERPYSLGSARQKARSSRRAWETGPCGPARSTCQAPHPLVEFGQWEAPEGDLKARGETGGVSSPAPSLLVQDGSGRIPLWKSSGWNVISCN